MLTLSSKASPVRRLSEAPPSASSRYATLDDECARLATPAQHMLEFLGENTQRVLEFGGDVGELYGSGSRGLCTFWGNFHLLSCCLIKRLHAQFIWSLILDL